ncbi:MAG: SET domain-containing protein-lysine N-methyltransferase [Opitutae bacterium]|nr:SET domain-containing protein-lysine N-methyltransferase [Opitutae bacterium]
MNGSAQKKLRSSVYVGECALGQGLFAGRDFGAGEEILQLTGPLISLAETISMGEQEANPLQIGIGKYIDMEEPGVFLNHSCEPNAGIVKSRTLIALSSIEAGEEIRYDYSTTMDENRWTMVCLCGAKGCRGLVQDFRLLPFELQSSYLRRGVVQEFIANKLKGAHPEA